MKRIGTARGALRSAGLVLALGVLASSSAHAQARHGGSLNWVVNPIPTSLIPLTTSAGGNSDIGPKVVEGLLTYEYDLKPKAQAAGPRIAIMFRPRWE